MVMITIVRITRTGSCFVIEEYPKASYKKVVEKIAELSLIQNVTRLWQKVSFFVNGSPMKYFFMTYSDFEFLSDQELQLDISDSLVTSH